MKYLALFLAAGLCATIADVPSRKAYEGFEWGRVTGAGLSFWAQHNPDIRVMADPSLPGAVVVRNGDTAPRKVITEKPFHRGCTSSSAERGRMGCKSVLSVQGSKIRT